MRESEVSQGLKGVWAAIAWQVALDEAFGLASLMMPKSSSQSPSARVLMPQQAVSSCDMLRPAQGHDPICGSAQKR